MVVEIISLSILRNVEAKKPSLDDFFEMASVVGAEELSAMSNRQIEQTAIIISK